MHRIHCLILLSLLCATAADAAPLLRITVRQAAEPLPSRDESEAKRSYSTGDRAAPALIQSIDVPDGQWARIDMGQSLPQVSQTVTAGGGVTQIQQSVTYKDVTSGFDVLPRVDGDHVQIELRAYRGGVARDDGGRIDTALTETTVEGRLGEWIAVSRQSGSEPQEAETLVYSTRARAVAERSVQIKVDLVF